VTVRKSIRSAQANREPKPARRDPRMEGEAGVIATEAAVAKHRVRGVTHTSGPPEPEPAPPDVAAELIAEKEARTRDSALLGEMFARAVDADAKKRTAELAVESLTATVAALEAELREMRAKRGAAVAAVAQEGEERARVLEDQLLAVEQELKRTAEKLKAAEEQLLSAGPTLAANEAQLRAAKEEAAAARDRIAPLEAALRSARSDREGEQTRAMDLARKIDELDRRASRAEQEGDKARSDAETARRRSAGMETELARMMKRAAELERDVTATRAEADTARKALQASQGELEALRAASQTARAELETAQHARTTLESELRARQEGHAAAQSLLAAFEIEEQRTVERRRKDLTELREALERGEVVSAPASRPPAPTSARPPVRGTLTGMQGVFGDRPGAAAAPATRTSSPSEALKAAVSEAAKRK
jgi:predicted  nucleic acid-binding Zn-ribbon protein